MPVCPFCRKPVEAGSIWCHCGANLVRYPNLPVENKDIKVWLAKYEPQFLTSSWLGGSLLEKAKERLLSGQDEEITTKTKSNAEMTEAKTLIKSFLLDCKKEGLVPTIDIGRLRRERWRQWKRIPAEYRQHAPLKDFKLTPGYFIETSVAQFKDEYCLGVEGTIYKHQLNAPDPFTLEALLGVVPVQKLAEALMAALIGLLKAKQRPDVGQKQIAAKAAMAETATVAAESAAPKRRLRLPFGRDNGGAGEAPGTQEGAKIAAKSEIQTKEAQVPATVAPALSATPKRRVGKADRRVRPAAGAVTPERRTAKADRRTPKSSKAPAAAAVEGAQKAETTTPKRRVGKADRRVRPAAGAVTPERRTAKADRRTAKPSEAPDATTAEEASKTESLEGARIRLETTKS